MLFFCLLSVVHRILELTMFSASCIRTQITIPFRQRRVLTMLAMINRVLDWIRSLFWKEEMELTLVGLQGSGKTTFVNVIAVWSEGCPLGTT